MRLTFAGAEVNLIFLLYMGTQEPKTVLLKVATGFFIEFGLIQSVITASFVL